MNDLLSFVSTEVTQEASGRRGRGVWAAWVSGGLALGVSAVCAAFAWPAVRRVCLPYVPATTSQVRHVCAALRTRNPVTAPALLDVGSGDGRLVRAARDLGFHAHGVELNPCLVLYCRARELLERSSVPRAYYHRADLWRFPLHPYHNILLFGVDDMMHEFEHKLLKEASPGTMVIACRFPLPSLVPQETIGSGVDTVWTYIINSENNTTSASQHP